MGEESGQAPVSTHRELAAAVWTELRPTQFEYGCPNYQCECVWRQDPVMANLYCQLNQIVSVLKF